MGAYMSLLCTGGSRSDSGGWERGVTDCTQEPTDHFYGTDMGLRDPSGNPIRILQQGKAASKATA